MKKILILFMLATCLIASPVYAIETKNCDSLTGGVQRSLDYISVKDLNNGDRAIVVYASGVSYYFGYFKYDATGTTAESITSHPYYVRPDDYVTAGVWYEVLANFIDLAADLSITNLTVTSLLTVNDVAASGKLSGGIIYHPLKEHYTITGISRYGGYITGVSEPEWVSVAVATGITVTVPEATGTGENIFLYNYSNTYNTGDTLFVHFNAADTIIGNQTFTAGTSKFILSGTSPFDTRLMAWSGAVNVWNVLTIGSPTVDWD